MSDILQQIEAVKAARDGMDDDLCKVLLMISATRRATIIPQPDSLTPKPVIMVPQRIYNRMLEMVPAKEDRT